MFLSICRILTLHAIFISLTNFVPGEAYKSYLHV